MPDDNEQLELIVAVVFLVAAGVISSVHWIGYLFSESKKWDDYFKREAKRLINEGETIDHGHGKSR